jgi:hypothetical protein
MCIQAYWDDPATRQIAIVHFQDGWNWEHAYHAQRQLHQMIETVSYPVGVVVRTSDMVNVPTNAISEGRRILSCKHENSRVLVLVTKNMMVRALFTIYNRLHWREPAKQFHIVNSMEDARTCIGERLPVGV